MTIVHHKNVSIEIRFLVSGHSCMACDSDFRLTEIRKKADVKTMVPVETES